MAKPSRRSTEYMVLTPTGCKNAKAADGVYYLPDRVPNLYLACDFASDPTGQSFGCCDLPS